MSEVCVQLQTCARVPTQYGDFLLCLYTNNQDDKEHLALVRGEVEGEQDVLIRMHSECFTGDVLGSQRCDCGEQLDFAMRSIAKEERGAILYLRQEGRGIGLLDKLRAYNLQDEGFDTVDANILLGHPPDSRDYRIAAAIIRELGIKSAHLLTNNPEKVDGLRSEGIVITARTALPAMVTEENLSYLETKQQRMNHLISLDNHSQEPPPDSTER